MGGSPQEAEFREFAQGCTAQLFRSACLLTTGDTHLAEDLVQETLSRMYVVLRRSSWHPAKRRIDNPAAYAQTVLVREFLAHRRRRSSGERPVGDFPELPGHDTDSTLRLALLDALGQLAAHDRAVLVLRFWEDLSVEQTADAMRLSAGAVRTRTTRALARLRALLGDSLSELAAR